MNPADYRLPGRKGWWRDLTTIIGIGTVAQFILALIGWDEWSWRALFAGAAIAVPVAWWMGVLTERPTQPVDDQW